ncbi:MAG: citryl-CoA lyase [Candidatus Sungbacteria bacterium]|nr:citryl-CoA lyase [Candidatus Sungbacteria bacterium]
MKWKTAISQHANGTLFVYGHELTELIEKAAFSEVIFLLLKGTLPTKKEAQLLDACLVAMAEHGIQAPSTFVARTSISVGNPFNAALAAGILATGDWHGGAIEKCAQYLQSGKDAPAIIGEVGLAGGRMPGFGHKVYKDEDPRASVLFTKARELGCAGTCIALVHEIKDALEKKTGKKLPINVDGAVAALVSELGIDWRFGKALFILGRMPGLMAHIREEMVNEKPYRRLEDDEVKYVG